MQILLLALLSGSVANPPSPFPTSAALSLLEEAQKAGRDAAFCLTIDGKTPTDAFFKLVRAKFPNASPSKDCYFNKSSTVHRPTGQTSYLVSLTNFHQTSQSTATAAYSAYGGPLAAGWYSVHFVRAHGEWHVKDIHLNRIS